MPIFRLGQPKIVQCVSGLMLEPGEEAASRYFSTGLHFLFDTMWENIVLRTIKKNKRLPKKF